MIGPLLASPASSVPWTEYTEFQEAISQIVFAEIAWLE
jgi:hypothetical protein